MKDHTQETICRIFRWHCIIFYLYKSLIINYMKNKYTITDWLPTSAKEIELHEWSQIDVILFTGDAYIDHPSFGSAVIGRILENQGFRVAIVPQPNWRDDLRDFKKLGKPRLFFGVTAGAMDSMVNHYTANKRLRSNDAYTAGGKSGQRPDYAVVTYSQILKNLFPDVPLIIGGIEASLRRVTHYDYWSDSLKHSVLFESKADMLVWGMGEKAIVEIAQLLDKGVKISNLQNIPQTAFLLPHDQNYKIPKDWKTFELFSHADCLNDKINYAKNFKVVEQESNKKFANQLTQLTGEKSEFRVVINPGYSYITEKEADATYNLPYTRLPHPRYDGKGVIPAFEMIKFSVNTHRGCFGGCSFCTISAHQGKFIVSRSEKSILKEVEEIKQMPDFKGYLSDLGGPSANMYKMQGNDLAMCEKCVRPSCIFPSICSNLNTNHSALTALYKKVNNTEGIKKAFIGSGVRYDMLFDKDENIKNDKLEYAKELIINHVSGRLKVAPEHTDDKVLKEMRKPKFALFYKFKDLFDSVNKKHQLNYQLIPYFISSHPGSSTFEMANLAENTEKLNLKLEQVQDFTPTPMTLSAVVYYTGLHPYTLKPIFVTKNASGKLLQKKFFFWYLKENKTDILNELKRNKQFNIIKKLFGKP